MFICEHHDEDYDDEDDDGRIAYLLERFLALQRLRVPRHLIVWGRRPLVQYEQEAQVHEGDHYVAVSQNVRHQLPICTFLVRRYANDVNGPYASDSLCTQESKVHHKDKHIVL